MITRSWHVCVLIPAQNEEKLIPRCIQSVLRACDRLPDVVSCDIIVAVDASTDMTGHLARQLVGPARRCRVYECPGLRNSMGNRDSRSFEAL
jgi:glycosyltransferase involved in cell wall biosynthesis